MKTYSQELSTKLKQNIDDTAEALADRLPDFDMLKPIPEAKIKQAILDLTPDGLKKLYQKFGQQEVTEYLNEFSQGRRW